MTGSPADVVRGFLEVVRSGREPHRAGEFMAPLVRAHQVSADSPITIEREPDDYADHVEEMLVQFGRFEIQVDEFLVDGPKVYVRWTQFGRHLGVIDGVAPTGQALVTVASSVYRVDAGKIVEYWMQQDHAGLTAQLT
ncbi:Predicted ester cyclase [Frankineae bacterium MT45]|nr:Predicted ester cyclase [Frankineae bacterium MT45]